jgi:hypothetical protein
MKRYLNRIFPSTAVAEGAGVGAAPVAEAAGRACPSCSTPAAADQNWCLECGTRIEQGGARWHQPAAVMASVALIFVAGLALALSEVAKDADVAGAKTIRKTVAAAPEPTPVSPTPDTPAPPREANSGKDSKGDDLPDTSANSTDDNGPAAAAGNSSGASSGAGSSSDPLIGSSGSGSSGSSGSTFSGGGSSSGGTVTPTPEPVAAWPKGKEGWTVVLDTFNSKTQAENFARKATKKGIKAGILRTNGYEGFAAGQWVVWAGRFETEDEALDAGLDDYQAKGFGDSVEEIIEKKDTSSDANGAGKGSTTTGNTSSTETSTDK